jgi:hypothetical protein
MKVGRTGRCVAAATVAVWLASASIGSADVKSTESNRLQFGGTLGAMLNLFAGQAAKEGVQDVIAVKGDRKMRVFGERAQLIDLAGEKIYDIDLRRKTYKVTTFDELRKQIAEDAKKAEKAAKDEKPDEQADADHDVDFSVKPTGQTKTINGFTCHEVIATVTVRQKGQTLEQGGGLVLTNDLWLVPTVPAMKESTDFDVRYFKAIAGPYAAGISADEMARATALLPALRLALEKLNVEGASALDGTTIASDLTADSVKSAAELAEAAKEDDEPAAHGGLGGMFGGLGKKLAKKVAASKTGQDAHEAKTRVLMLHHEVLSIATSVAADEVAVPAGFRQEQ